MPLNRRLGNDGDGAPDVGEKRRRESVVVKETRTMVEEEKWARWIIYRRWASFIPCVLEYLAVVFGCFIPCWNRFLFLAIFQTGRFLMVVLPKIYISFNPSYTWNIHGWNWLFSFSYFKDMTGNKKEIFFLSPAVLIFNSLFIFFPDAKIFFYSWIDLHRCLLQFVRGSKNWFSVLENQR